MKHKEELKKIGGSLLYIEVLYSIVFYFQLSFVGTYYVFLVGTIGLSIYFKNFSISNFFISAAYIGVLFGGFYWLGQWGILGGLVGVFIISGIILFTRRKRFIQTKHKMEQLIWGKPLKEFVASGEKIPKIKISGLK